jgi:hypothetical protein
MNVFKMKDENKMADAPLTPAEQELAEKVIQIVNEMTTTKTRKGHRIGKMVNQFFSKSYGEDRFGLLAKETEINIYTLYKYRQVAKELTDEDIDILCDGGHFPLALKHIKANLKFGREKIMEIHAEAKTLKEFKEAFAKLRAEETQKKSQNIFDLKIPSENCPLGTNLDSPPNDTSTEVKTVFSDDEATNDKSNHGNVDDKNENSDPVDESNCETKDSHEGSDLKSEANAEKVTETESNPNKPVKDPTTDSEVSTDNLIAQEKAESESDEIIEGSEVNNGMPKASELDDIKFNAGSAIDIEPPNDTTGGSPEDILDENCPEEQNEYDDEFVNFTNAKAELARLRKENETLREERDMLRQENEGLKQFIKTLEAQSTEKELDPA